MSEGVNGYRFNNGPRLNNIDNSSDAPKMVPGIYLLDDTTNGKHNLEILKKMPKAVKPNDPGIDNNDDEHSGFYEWLHP